MMILGIDPGLEGGFAVRMDDSIILEVMPVKDGQMDLEELNRLIHAYAYEITHCYLEMQGVRPRQSSQSGFTTGRGFGRLEGMLASLGIKPIIVYPRDWSAAYDHGVTEQDPGKRYRLIKIARREIAERIYPGVNFLATDRSSVPHEGLVDSALIADFGFNRHKPMKGKS